VKRWILLTAMAVPAAAPAQQSITEYHIPTANAFPHDPAVRIWLAESGVQRLGRIDVPVRER
jgi:hypothetical protein